VNDTFYKIDLIAAFVPFPCLDLLVLVGMLGSRTVKGNSTASFINNSKY